MLKMTTAPNGFKLEDYENEYCINAAFKRVMNGEAVVIEEIGNNLRLSKAEEEDNKTFIKNVNKYVITRYCCELLKYGKFKPLKLNDVVLSLVAFYGKELIKKGYVIFNDNNLNEFFLSEDLKIIQNKRTEERYLISDSYTDLIDILTVMK